MHNLFRDHDNQNKLTYIYVDLHQSDAAPSKICLRVSPWEYGEGLVDNELVIPKVRGNMEKACTMVAEGKASMEVVALPDTAWVISKHDMPSHRLEVPFLLGSRVR